MSHALVRLGSLLLLVGLVPGCGPSTCSAPQARPAAVGGHADHDHGHDGHDHAPPAGFADGVKRLETLSRDLADSISDEGVHEFGHLLEEVREAAKQLPSAPAADVATITKALDDLEECFGKVDEAFHSGDEKIDPKQVLESVKERIEGAFTAIKEVL
jgi:hypothetical protein